MKLRTAKEKLTEEFRNKVSYTDLMRLINLLEAVDENARLETESKHIREHNKRESYG